MKKIETRLNKNSVKKCAAYLIRHRNLFLMAFFGVLFIFTFNVIYENVYYNMEHIDYVESRNFEDDEIKRDIIFEKVIENIKSRERAIRSMENKEYKNPFIFNDGRDFDESGNDSEENDNESDENSNDSDNNVPVVLPIEPSLLP